MCVELVVIGTSLPVYLYFPRGVCERDNDTTKSGIGHRLFWKVLAGCLAVLNLLAHTLRNFVSVSSCELTHNSVTSVGKTNVLEHPASTPLHHGCLPKGSSLITKKK